MARASSSASWASALPIFVRAHQDEVLRLESPDERFDLFGELLEEVAGLLRLPRLVVLGGEAAASDVVGRGVGLGLHFPLVERLVEEHAEEPEVLPVDQDHAVVVVALEDLHERRDDRPLPEAEPVGDGDGELVRFDPAALEVGVERDPLLRLVVVRLQPALEALEDGANGLVVVPRPIAVELRELGLLLVQEDLVRALVVGVDRHVEEGRNHTGAVGGPIDQRLDLLA
ncbi:MAG: hypothetical protein P8177_04965 [Gemmatimonadota bacterium]